MKKTFKFKEFTNHKETYLLIPQSIINFNLEKSEWDALALYFLLHKKNYNYTYNMLAKAKSFNKNIDNKTIQRGFAGLVEKGILSINNDNEYIYNAEFVKASNKESLSYFWRIINTTKGQKLKSLKEINDKIDQLDDLKDNAIENDDITKFKELKKQIKDLKAERDELLSIDNTTPTTPEKNQNKGGNLNDQTKDDNIPKKEEKTSKREEKEVKNNGNLPQHDHNNNNKNLKEMKQDYLTDYQTKIFNDESQKLIFLNAFNRYKVFDDIHKAEDYFVKYLNQNKVKGDATDIINNFFKNYQNEGGKLNDQTKDDNIPKKEEKQVKTNDNIPQHDVKDVIDDIDLPQKDDKKEKSTQHVNKVEKTPKNWVKHYKSKYFDDNDFFKNKIMEIYNNNNISTNIEDFEEKFINHIAKQKNCDPYELTEKMRYYELSAYI